MPAPADSLAELATLPTCSCTCIVVTPLMSECVGDSDTDDPAEPSDDGPDEQGPATPPPVLIGDGIKNDRPSRCTTTWKPETRAPSEQSSLQDFKRDGALVSVGPCLEQGVGENTGDRGDSKGCGVGASDDKSSDILQLDRNGKPWKVVGAATLTVRVASALDACMPMLARNMADIGGATASSSTVANVERVRFGILAFSI